MVNTSRPSQDSRHFADDKFNTIFVNENVRISNQLSLKFVPSGRYQYVDNKAAP